MGAGHVEGIGTEDQPPRPVQPLALGEDRRRCGSAGRQRIHESVQVAVRQDDDADPAGTVAKTSPLGATAIIATGRPR